MPQTGCGWVVGVGPKCICGSDRVGVCGVCLVCGCERDGGWPSVTAAIVYNQYGLLWPHNAACFIQVMSKDAFFFEDDIERVR